ncbi:MAG: TIGR00153 family protein [Candidatus Bipolaricaulota bacterium]|nr:TIGR00153 family protein [Candidatus Bipolaricaulota bacterium]
MAFWKKQKQIETLVLAHLNSVDESLVLFQEAFTAYLDGDMEKADQLALETHRAEGQADDVRRKVEVEMLGGALLATSRRDILEIVEEVDKLANAGEAVLDCLLLQQIEIPEELKPTFREILSKTREIFEEVKQALHLFFQDMNRALEHTKAIEVKEGEVDQLERAVIKQLFAMDLNLAEKLQVRGLVEYLVEPSDRAEDLSDRIDMMIAQRRF